MLALPPPDKTTPLFTVTENVQLFLRGGLRIVLRTTEFTTGLAVSDPVVICILYLIWLNSTSLVNTANDSPSLSAVTIVSGEASSISYRSTAVAAAVMLAPNTRPALKNFLNNLAPTFSLGPTITPVLVVYK